MTYRIKVRVGEGFVVARVLRNGAKVVECCAGSVELAVMWAVSDVRDRRADGRLLRCRYSVTATRRDDGQYLSVVTRGHDYLTHAIAPEPAQAVRWAVSNVRSMRDRGGL